MIVICKLNLKGVSMKKTYKTKIKRQKKDDVVFLLVSNWENVDDYSEEEIEDLLEENHIPEISYIDVIEKPDNIIFD
jgi:hypothetical protein